MNRTVSFHSPPYLFLRSFFRVFNPSHWEPHPLVFHPRAPTIALKHQCRYPLSYETSLCMRRVCNGLPFHTRFISSTTQAGEYFSASDPPQTLEGRSIYRTSS